MANLFQKSILDTPSAVTDNSGMIGALDVSSSDDDSDTATKRDLDKMMRDIKKANEKLLTKLSDAMEVKLGALQRQLEKKVDDLEKKVGDLAKSLKS